MTTTLFLMLMLMLLEQCRRTTNENTDHRLQSVVTSMYWHGMATVTSSGADDVIHDEVDDEDNRRVMDGDDLERSGSGDVASPNWDRRPFSDSAGAHGGTKRWGVGATPTSLLLNVGLQRFRQASGDVAMATRHSAAASSSTSWRSNSFLLTQLALTVLWTRSFFRPA